MSKSDWSNVPENIEDYQGFCYIITDTRTNMKYIGQKSFWNIEKRDALKTRTKEEEKKRQALQIKYDKGLIKTKKELKALLGELTIKERERRSKLSGVKRKVKVETKWRDYYGSSEKFLEYLEENGHDGVKREIIWLCTSKWWLSYLELKEQLEANALFRDDFYNGIINIRLGNVVSGEDLNKQVKVFSPDYSKN